MCSVFIFSRLCLFYLIHAYCLFNLISLPIFIVIYPMEHPTGFQSIPAECFPKGVTCEAPLSYFGYIGWKPGRKFRSRLRMDGSAVCTRDTTPPTEMGLKCIFVFFYRIWTILIYFMCLVNFIIVHLIMNFFYHCLTLLCTWLYIGEDIRRARRGHFSHN